MRRTNAEHGFTLIEVIVAALILAILAAGAMLAIGSTSTNQNRAKIVARQRAIADGIAKKINADPKILSDASRCVPAEGCSGAVGGCYATSPTYPCTNTLVFTAAHPIVRVLLAEQEATIVQHSIRVRFTGYDDPVDGTTLTGANRDRDGIIPDRYLIVVENTTTAQGTRLDADATPNSTTYRSQTTVNFGKRAETGSLIVNACAVSQVDERLPTGLCTGATRTLQMRPPAGCPGSTSQECRAWTSARQAHALPGAATSALPAGAPAPTTVRVIPVTTGTYNLQGPLKKTGNTLRTGLSVGQTVNNLPPGEYIITFPNPPEMNSAGNVVGAGAGTDMTVWQSHSIPGDGRVSIEAGNLKRSVVAFKPRVSQASPPRLLAYSMDETYPTEYDLLSSRTFWIDANHLRWFVRPVALSDLTIKLMPVPSGRTTLTRSATQGGWTRIPAWTGYPLVPFNELPAIGAADPARGSSLPAELEPGLYAAYVIHNQTGYPFGKNALLRQPGSVDRRSTDFTVVGRQARPGAAAFLQYVYVRPGETGTIGALYNRYCLTNKREAWIDEFCQPNDPWCWLNRWGIWHHVASCGADTDATGTGATGTGGV